MKGIILYKGKYGATEQYAEWVSARTNLAFKPSHECTQQDLQSSDFLVMGTSVYMGMLGIKEWLKNNTDLLRGKKLFLFVVCSTLAQDAEKLEEYVSSSVPAQLRPACNIYFLPGRLDYKKLTWSDRFMLRIGALFTKNENDKQRILKSFDSVKIEHIESLVSDIRRYMTDYLITSPLKSPVTN
ncbi:MAG: flavodoxin domain-containing protein [Chitinophagaceae bacterium]